MRKEKPLITEFLRYRLEEFNYRSSSKMLDKFVKVYFDEIDITEIVANIIDRKLSKNKKCFNSFYNYNCYGFSLTTIIKDYIKEHQHEIANAVQIHIYKNDL